MVQHDSDSGHSPIDNEKHIGVKPGEFETLDRGELPPDPDSHLSEEERAAIVHPPYLHPPSQAMH